MRRFVPVFVLLIGLLCLLPVVAQTTGSPPPGDFMGMVIRDPYYEFNTNPNYPNQLNRDFYDALGQNLAYAGVRWVRFEFRAESNIPYNPNEPGQGIHFEAYDYFINEVAPRHGLKIIALLATQIGKDPGNPHANPDGYLNPEYYELAKAPAGDGELPDRCWEYRYGCGTTKAMRIWLDHSFAIAARYGDRIAAYELMNEQNRYINGGGNGISPVAMATLQTKFYRIFKKTGFTVTDPVAPLPWQNGHVPPWAAAIKIIVGGLQVGPCDDCAAGSKKDYQYLDALYKSPPFQDFRTTYAAYPTDGIGYHPYPMDIHLSPVADEPSGIGYLTLLPNRLQIMRDVMVSNGDTANKIWITEIGDRGDPNIAENQARQADFLHGAYWMLWGQRAFIETVLWFKYEDFAVPHNTENWGVVRLVPGSTTEYKPSGEVQVYKQSYAMYRNLATYGIPQWVPPTPTPTNTPIPPTSTPTAIPTATPNGPNGTYVDYLPLVHLFCEGVTCVAPPTATPSATGTATPTATVTSTATSTATGTATATLTATSTQTSSATATSTAVPTATATRTATATASATPSSTATVTTTASATATVTRTPGFVR